MSTWIQILIALPVASAIVIGLWKVSEALTRRGIVVRPVDLMDANMTKIERRFSDHELKSTEPPVAQP